MIEEYHWNVQFDCPKYSFKLVVGGKLYFYSVQCHTMPTYLDKSYNLLVSLVPVVALSVIYPSTSTNRWCFVEIFVVRVMNRRTYM